MSKCGKGCMPECEYFTTGGCISPFNCMYKIETSYINTATSQPERGMMIMTEQEIERCLERLSSCKTADVINFDYAGTLAYIKRLKEENVTLRERLEKALELPRIERLFNGKVGSYKVVYQDKNNRITSEYYSEEKREAAEARLAELKGEKK